MTATARKRAFLLAAAAAVLAALVIAVAAGPGRPPTSRTPRHAPIAAPRDRTPEPPKRPYLTTHPPTTGNPRAARSAGRAVAERFLATYLRYETHATRTRARELERLTVAGSDARRMLHTPPRPTGDVARGRIVLVEIHGPYRGWWKASVIVRYGGRRLLIELALVRDRRGRYRVREVSL